MYAELIKFYNVHCICLVVHLALHKGIYYKHMYIVQWVTAKKVYSEKSFRNLKLYFQTHFFLTSENWAFFTKVLISRFFFQKFFFPVTITLIRTLYSVHSTVYTVQCTMYTVLLQFQNLFYCYTQNNIIANRFFCAVSTRTVQYMLYMYIPKFSRCTAYIKYTY